MSSFEEKPEPLSFLSKDMCRICLKSGSASSVRASVIAEKYRDVTSFEVQPTDIPQKVCLQCNNLILELFEFVQTCKRTEETLRALQGGLKVEKKDIPESPGFSGIEAQAHPIEACFVLDIKEEAPETDTSGFWGGVESFSPEPSSLEIPSAQPEPSFDCSECGKSYLSRKSLQRHLARVHKITIPLPEKTPDLTDAEKKKRDAHDQVTSESEDEEMHPVAEGIKKEMHEVEEEFEGFEDEIHEVEEDLQGLEAKVQSSKKPKMRNPYSLDFKLNLLKEYESMEKPSIAKLAKTRNISRKNIQRWIHEKPRMLEALNSRKVNTSTSKRLRGKSKRKGAK